MIAKTAIISEILTRLKKLPQGHYLDVRTYKRDRGIFIIRRSDDMFEVIEDGFYQDEFRVPFARMRNVLKTLLKKEFPRSRKIRLYAMGEYCPQKAASIGRKVI